MCGIAGGWFASGEHAPAVYGALGALRHRGPDDEGMFENGPVCFGMRRLAIIDIHRGQQPIHNEDGSVVVICNGEIYNYRELAADLQRRGHVFRTESDTEVLAHLYEDEGTDMCDRLRGMFAFAIWDARRRRLMLGRDRFGKKPLFYSALHGGQLCFASELKALLPLLREAGITPPIRQQAVYDYLSLGAIPQPETIYEGIYALKPGAWLTFDGERASTQRYWTLPYAPKQAMAYEEATVCARELVAQAVELRLRCDVPFGVFLSGGLDSTIVTYEAARHTGPDLQTFTVGMGDPSLDESATARRTARALGVRNTVLRFEVSPLRELLAVAGVYDQPYADASAIPSIAISRLARQHVTVVMNGDGGDEIFGGYRRHLAARLSGRAGPLARAFAPTGAALLQRLARTRRSAAGFAARFCRGLTLSAGQRYLAWTTDLLREEDKQAIWQGDRMRPTEDWIGALLPVGLSALDIQLAGDVRVNLLSDLLVKMDMATMAASLECRSPFLDYRLAEFAGTLPDSYRVRGVRTKAVLRDAYRGLIPEEVRTGKKKGFEPPLQAWLDADFREIVRDTLGSSGARVRDYVDGAFVDGLMEKTILADRNRSALLYALLVLELWLRDSTPGTPLGRASRERSSIPYYH
jgi:asparagine synthase (glutamine-hydrolysing)